MFVKPAVQNISVFNKMDISELLKSEEVQRHFRAASSVVGSTVYNELYFYIWFICIYNILLLTVVVVNLYLLIRWIRRCPDASPINQPANNNSI